MYALNLSTENRILSATYERFAAPGQPLVATLPEGDISNYLYINEQYIYDPLPEPEPPEPPEPAGPTADEILDVLLGGEENE